MNLSQNKNNKVPDLDIYNENMLGGHCMLVTKYDDNLKSFLVLNSWGTKWGDNGYHYMSYRYVCSDLCNDFWVASYFKKNIKGFIKDKLLSAIVL